MNQSRLLRLLLQPSLFSGTVISTVTLLAIGGSAWSYVSSRQLLYDFIFGAYGLKTYIWQQSLGISTVKSALLASPAAYYILVGLVATAAGLIVYAFLQGIGLIFSWRVWSGLDTLGPNRAVIARELLRRVALRVIALTGWGVFGACFFSMILPFTALMNQAGVARIEEGAITGWLTCLAAALILATSLHLHVVFLRLAMLRPRIFWGASAAEEAEAHSLAQ